MARQTLDDEIEEKPLDPAVESVRRKLVRFIAINLGMLFAALMAVVAAIVYKSAPRRRPADGPGRNAAVWRDRALPAGAKMIVQSFSGGRILDRRRACRRLPGHHPLRRRRQEDRRTATR